MIFFSDFNILSTTCFFIVPQILRCLTPNLLSSFSPITEAFVKIFSPRQEAIPPFHSQTTGPVLFLIDYILDYILELASPLLMHKSTRWHYISSHICILSVKFHFDNLGEDWYRPYTSLWEISRQNHTLVFISTFRQWCFPWKICLAWTSMGA